MATGTAVAAGELITHTKMNLKQEDYELVDDEELVLGTGDDFKVDFDGTNIVITLALQFSITCTGGHLALDTVEDNKQVRLNCRDFAQTSGDSIGFQTRPRASVSGTQTVYGGQSGPGFNDGIAGNSLVGHIFDCILKGTSGNLSGDIRAVQGQITDENSAGRTIDGVSSILDAWHQLAAHTFTGCVYVINVRAPGGATPWSGFAVFPDDSQIASDGEDKSGGTVGWIKVKIGSKVGYIQVDSLS